MTKSKASLGDLLEPSGQHRAGKNDYPVLSITMKQGLVDQADKFKKRVASQDVSNYRVAFRNELVVGFPIDEGVLGFQTKYPAAIVSPAYDIWRLKNETDCHIPYLERYLRSTQARRLYASRMQGAVARRRSLTKADFLQLEIPFPRLDDQIRIAHLLGKVEGLIAQRKQQLQQLDDLLKSVFLEMFGDPVRNEKGWAPTTIGALATDVKYGTSASAQGGPYKYLRMNNITQDGYWDFESLKYIDASEKELEKYSLKRGDLVFNRTNSKELVGKTAVYDQDEPVIIAGYLIRVRFDERTNPWFVWGHLNSKFGKTRLFNLCRNIVGMANINAKELQAIPILQPPTELQDEFATVVGKVENVKSGYKISLTDLEVLYGALNQQAFKGELDLSRVPLPDTEPQESQYAMSASSPSPTNPPNTPHLPDTKLLLAALDDRAHLKELLPFWLEAYRAQLNGAAFSSQDFLSAAQTRIAQLHPDNDFELGADAYEQVKAWVFEALVSGRLMQGYADADNRVTLASQSPDWGTW